MVSENRPEPCPIPRCALEWYLASEMLVIAALLGVVADNGSVAAALGFGHFPVARLGWGLLMGIPAVVQIVSLLTRNRLLQRWAAFIASIVSLSLATILLQIPSLPILAGVLLVQTIAEFIVFAILKGARWNFSTKSSATSRSPG